MTDPEVEIRALADRVAALERRLAALEGGSQPEQTSGYVYGATEDAPATQDPWSVPPWPEVVALLQGGRKIEAIKVYREHTGVGLKQAKDTIDEVESRMR